MPKAHMPMQINNSSNVGKYSTISPRGVGINPVTTIPGPFSIQIPTIDRMQATFAKDIFFARVGTMKMAAAMNSIEIANHIHGTSMLWPCRPKKRYRAELE